MATKVESTLTKR